MKVARSFLGRLQTSARRIAHNPKQTGIAAGCLVLGVAGVMVKQTYQVHGDITVDPAMLGGLLTIGFGGGLLGDVLFPGRRSGVNKKAFGLS